MDSTGKTEPFGREVAEGIWGGIGSPNHSMYSICADQWTPLAPPLAVSRQIWQSQVRVLVGSQNPFVSAGAPLPSSRHVELPSPARLWGPSSVPIEPEVGSNPQTLHVCHICRSVGVVPEGSMGRQSYGSPMECLGSTWTRPDPVPKIGPLTPSTQLYIESLNPSYEFRVDVLPYTVRPSRGRLG